MDTTTRAILSTPLPGSISGSATVLPSKLHVNQGLEQTHVPLGFLDELDEVV